MKAKTFAELYCERERVPVAKVPERLFRLTLYPHARLVAGILRRLNHRHFLADYEFIEDVGYLRSLHDFSLALGSYIEHPDNRGLLRRTFRLRISARRMLQLVRSVYSPTGTVSRKEPRKGNTLEPFGEGARDPNSAVSRDAEPPLA